MAPEKMKNDHIFWKCYFDTGPTNFFVTQICVVLWKNVYTCMYVCTIILVKKFNAFSKCLLYDNSSLKNWQHWTARRRPCWFLTLVVRNDGMVASGAARIVRRFTSEQPTVLPRSTKISPNANGSVNLLRRSFADLLWGHAWKNTICEPVRNCRSL